MIPLKGLEGWAREIVSAETPELNRLFGSSLYEKGEDLIRASIEDLPFFSGYRAVFRTLSEPTLRELNGKLRGQNCETNFWIVLPGVLNHALPDEVAFDLIEREIAISWLAHSPQSEAVLWRLGPLMDEAILTLAKRFYTDKNRTVEEFESILRRFPDCVWMLHALAFCSASSLEKRRAYEKAIENRPEREDWMEIHPSIGANQKHFSYFDWSDFKCEASFEDLYGIYDAQKILGFARDDQTPDEILHELEELRGFPNAKEVRIAARANLRRREENHESHI